MKKEISYCLKCWGKKRKNEHIEGVALENKIGQQKSTLVVCDSKQSTFLKPIKQIKQIKSKKQFSQIVKTNADLLFGV